MTMQGAGGDRHGWDSGYSGGVDVAGNQRKTRRKVIQDSGKKRLSNDLIP